MKRIVVLLIGGFVFLSTQAFAHPPQTLELDYIASEGNLYIYMDHLSRDHRDHYIRKIVIYKNGEEIGSKANRQQINPLSASFVYPLETEIDDEITVKAYCKEGGSKTTTLNIEEQGEDEEYHSDIKDKIENTKIKNRRAQTHSASGSKDPFASKSDVYGDTSEVYNDKTDPFKDKQDAFKSKDGVYEHKGSVY